MQPASEVTLNELARQYRARHRLPQSARGKVLRKLAVCRTPAMGGRLLACDQCTHREVAWKSCLDRHCPSCMGASAKAWVKRQESALLPVPYFHIVFTLPRRLGDLALYNKSALYGLLMRVSAEVLQTIAGDKKYFGGRIGFVSVLHTWSQTLEHHPHVHMVVAGGALCDKGTAWRASKPNFFLPTRVLAALFRRRFLEEVAKLREAGALSFRGKVAGLIDDEAWEKLVRDLRARPWVVYAKPPFGGPAQVLRYLSRYTHRVAISNRRLQSFDGRIVAFTVRASAATNQHKILRLELDDFIERFLLHLLPRGFTRIRSYGFLAGRYREANLQLIRALLGAPRPEAASEADEREDRHCPECGHGVLQPGADVAPHAAPSLRPIRKSLIASTGPPRSPVAGLDVLTLARAAA